MLCTKLQRTNFFIMTNQDPKTILNEGNEDWEDGIDLSSLEPVSDEEPHLGPEDTTWTNPSEDLQGTEDFGN